MSYFRPMGEDDPCSENPDDPVCKEFYAPAAPAPESGSVFTGFANMIEKGVAAITGQTPATPTASATKVASKSSLVPIVVVGGAAVGLWWFLRKKK